MEDIIHLNEANTVADRIIKTNNDGITIPPQKSINNSAIENLIAEGGNNFSHYLNLLGLTNDQNMLVLSSSQHYYYDHSELKSMTTLISMKKLNLIKHIDNFLNVLYHVLSPRANFVGCFCDSNSLIGLGLISRMYKGFINFLDSRVERDFDRGSISSLLESHGFQVIDMTEINGLTYFRTQKIRISVD